MTQDSINKLNDQKEIATKKLIVHIAEVENEQFTRKYRAQLYDKIRYPEWNNCSSDCWMYFIDCHVRDSWHHFDDLAKLAIYLTAIGNIHHVIP